MYLVCTLFLIKIWKLLSRVLLHKDLSQVSRSVQKRIPTPCHGRFLFGPPKPLPPPNPTPFLPFGLYIAWVEDWMSPTPGILPFFFWSPSTPLISTPLEFLLTFCGGVWMFSGNAKCRIVILCWRSIVAIAIKQPLLSYSLLNPCLMIVTLSLELD